MKFQLKTLFIFTLLSFLILSLWTLLFGFYYEEGTDVYLKLIANGFYTGSPEILFNEGLLKAHGYLLQTFYITNANIEWYDILSFFHIGILILLFLYVLKSILRKQIGIKLIILFPIVVLFLNSLFFIQSTRIAIMIGGILFIILFEKLNFQKFSFPILLFLVGGIEYAALIRLDSVLLMFLFFIPFLIFSLLKSYKKAHVFTIGLLFLSIFLTNIYYQSDQLEVDLQYSKIKPYTYTLWDFERTPVTSYSFKDSVIIESVKRKFLDDELVINKGFFEKAEILAIEKDKSNLLNVLSNSKQIFVDFWTKKMFNYREYLPMLLLYVFLVIMFHFKISKSETKHFLFSQLWFMLLCGFIIVFLKPEFRVLSPFLAVNLLYLLNTFKLKPINKWNALIINFMAMFVLVLNYSKYEGIKENTQKFVSNISWLNSNYSHKTLFTTLNIFDFANTQLVMNKPFQVANYYTIHNAQAYMYASYKKEMKLLTNSDNFIGYVSYISSCKECLLISSKYRIETLQNYLDAVYGKKYSFNLAIPLGKDNKIELNDNFNLYQINKLDK